MKNHDRFFGMVTLKDGSGKKKKKTVDPLSCLPL